jgi:hypothetical protein
MSRGRKFKDLAIPATSWDVAGEWHTLISNLEKESDRAVAVLGAAYLDTALQSLLEASFAGGKAVREKLFDGVSAPLGSFSARITMAYALGHIGPNYFATLNAVREIRNAFAHFRRGLTFDDQEVQERMSSTFKLPYVLPDPPPELSSFRNRYIWTTAMILGHLGSAASNVSPPHLPPGL